jgi:prevent-host-death family protein
MTMRSVPIAQFKDNLSEFVAAAEAGEDVVVTRHGKPAVRLIAARSPDLAEQRRLILKDMMAREAGNRGSRKPVTADEIIAWRNEGRR